MRIRAAKANRPSSDTEPADPERRRVLGFLALGTVLAAATMYGLIEWEGETVPKVTVDHLLSMSDAEKRQLVSSGDIFGIRNATVRVLGERSFAEPTQVLTRYGKMNSSRNVDEVRYLLSDATGQIGGYADNRDASIQIEPDQLNQDGVGQFELVQGRLRYNAPTDHPQDNLLPTGYFIQIDLA